MPKRSADHVLAACVGVPESAMACDWFSHREPDASMITSLVLPSRLADATTSSLREGVVRAARRSPSRHVRVAAVARASSAMAIAA